LIPPLDRYDAHAFSLGKLFCENPLGLPSEDASDLLTGEDPRPAVPADVLVVWVVDEAEVQVVFGVGVSREVRVEEVINVAVVDGGAFAVGFANVFHECDEVVSGQEVAAALAGAGF
jgi:hypothetical protein